MSILLAMLLTPVYIAEGIAWVAVHVYGMVMLIPDAIEGADHYWESKQ